MGIWVNIKNAEKEVQTLSGRLSPQELEIDEIDDLIKIVHPLQYKLQVSHQGANLVITGCLELGLECLCARCLQSFQTSVVLEDYHEVVPLEGEDASPIINDLVDLTPFIREDSLLALPTTPVCGTKCPGLPSYRPGREGAVWEKGPDFWAELNKLKNDI